MSDSLSSAPSTQGSGGAPLAPATGSGGAAGGVRSQLARRELVQHTVQSSLDRAKTLYDSSAPAFLKSSVERTSWLSEPLVSRLTALAPPVIRCLDNGLGAAYTKLGGAGETGESAGAHGDAGAPLEQLEGEHLLVDDRWFSQVDELLQQRREDVHRFYSKAADAFAGLQDVTYGDFSDSLRQLLPDLEDRYVAPSKAFYVAALARWREQPNVDVRELVTSIRERFERVWEQRLVHNGRTVYDEAIRYYAAVADRNPTVAQLVDGMQARLGGVWEGRLAGLLRDLFARAKELPVSAFAHVRPAAEAAAASGKATAAVPAARAQAALSSALEALRARWSGLLNASERAVDRLLPPQGEGEAAALDADDAALPAGAPVGVEGRHQATCLSVARTAACRLGARAVRVPRAAADATGLTAAAARATQWPRARAADLRRRLARVVALTREAGCSAGRSIRTRRPARLPYDVLQLARQLARLDAHDPALDEFLGHAGQAVRTAAGVCLLAWVWAPEDAEKQEQAEEQAQAVNEEVKEAEEHHEQEGVQADAAVATADAFAAAIDADAEAEAAAAAAEAAPKEVEEQQQQQQPEEEEEEEQQQQQEPKKGVARRRKRSHHQ